MYLHVKKLENNKWILYLMDVYRPIYCIICDCYLFNNFSSYELKDDKFILNCF